MRVRRPPPLRTEDDPLCFQTALRHGSSTAAKDQTVKGTSDSKKIKKNLEISDSRSDVVQPAKKFKRINIVMEDNQHLPRPLVSWKTRGPRKVCSVGNRLSLAMKESTDCSPAEIAQSPNSDYAKLGDVEKVGDRELNEEDFGPAEKLGVHSPKRTRDNDGKLSDTKVQMVEDTSNGSTKNLSDHGLLAVPQDVEKQVLGSTLHDTINDLNERNQAELASTNGISIPSGSSATAVQPCVGTDPQQSSDSPDAVLTSINRPERSLALPFQKYSIVWSVIESMDIFAKIPQNPHFSPLTEYEEEKREEVALQKMLKYAYLGDKISKLTIDDLKTSAVVNNILASLKELEECGFDVILIKRHLNDLLLNNERQTQFQNKLEEIHGRIRDCNLEKAKAEKEINEIAMKINDLKKEVTLASNVIETTDQEIMVLRSEQSAIGDEIRHVQLNFEETAVKQVFC